MLTCSPPLKPFTELTSAGPQHNHRRHSCRVGARRPVGLDSPASMFRQWREDVGGDGRRPAVMLPVW